MGEGSWDGLMGPVEWEGTGPTPHLVAVASHQPSPACGVGAFGIGVSLCLVCVW